MPDALTFMKSHAKKDEKPSEVLPVPQGKAEGVKITGDAAVATLSAMTEWLRANHARGFLGEFGVGRNADCLASLEAMLDYMAQNSDVWHGWTYWAAGSWWGDYMFTIEPSRFGEDRPQMAVLSRFFNRKNAAR